MAQPSDIEILERRIAELNIKIPIFEENGISDVKRNRLIEKRDRYVQQLADLQG